MSTKTVPKVYQWSKTVKNSQKTVKTAKWPLVYQSSHVYQGFTNSVPIVKNSQKTVKQQKWPLVYQSSHVYSESAEYTKSAVCVRVRRTHKALRLASIRLAWYRHMPASSILLRLCLTPSFMFISTYLLTYLLTVPKYDTNAGIPLSTNHSKNLVVCPTFRGVGHPQSTLAPPPSSLLNDCSSLRYAQ